MDGAAIFGISVSLAMDAFSVAIGAGTTIDRPTLRHYFRICFHFGLFQFMMPIIGYFVGASIGPWIRSYDHWAAMILLTFVGINMIRESFAARESTADPSRGQTLVILSVATSMDALAVGLSLGFTGFPIITASGIIGITCALFSIIGLSLGRKTGTYLGKNAERLGGATLIVIGILILQHLL